MYTCVHIDMHIYQTQCFFQQYLAGLVSFSLSLSLTIILITRKVNVKLSPCLKLRRHHAMKTCGGEQMQLHSSSSQH
jgi:hypothetical protein